MPQEVKGKFIVRDTITNGEFTFPHIDGDNGQTLITDGSGNVVWKDVLNQLEGGSSNSIYLTSQSADGGNA